MTAKILLLDIETAPNKVYTWGLFNENVGLNQIEEPGYTICFAAKWMHKKQVIFKSIYHHSPEEMVLKAWELLDEADIIVHYNGKRFDVPILFKEFLLRGLTPPSSFEQIDLYTVVRSNFKFASNKLDFIVQQLGFGSKVHHKGMELWRDCMNNVPSAWKLMKEYNIQDVNLMTPLYEAVIPWAKTPPNMGLYVDADELTCRKCGSINVIKNGIERKVTVKYQRYKCQDCGANLRGRLRLGPTDDGVLV